LLFEGRSKVLSAPDERWPVFEAVFSTVFLLALHLAVLLALAHAS
jgi:hypothetical protein